MLNTSDWTSDVHIFVSRCFHVDFIMWRSSNVIRHLGASSHQFICFDSLLRSIFLCASLCKHISWYYMIARQIFAAAAASASKYKWKYNVTSCVLRAAACCFHKCIHKLILDFIEHFIVSCKFNLVAIATCRLLFVQLVFFSIGFLSAKLILHSYWIKSSCWCYTFCFKLKHTIFKTLKYAIKNFMLSKIDRVINECNFQMN